VDSTEWYYVKARLAESHRLIVWDLPGLGLSKGPRDADWSLEKMARDLDAVLELADNRPAILVGHSIGGMISLTHLRLFPEAMGTRVAGLGLVHTTYTNPVKTAALAPLYSAIQKPIIEPLLRLTIALAPLVWLMNWLSYLNGSLHRSSEKSGFTGRETREQLEFVTRYSLEAWPAVLARGMFGMLRYDATEILPSIRIPTLVIAGDQDRECTPEASRTMAQTIPGASLEVLSPARHMGHFEHNGRFVEVLDRFIRSCRHEGIGVS
jgi:pimeloyl-ACP methyl ester carboxylesterase